MGKRRPRPPYGTTVKSRDCLQHKPEDCVYCRIKEFDALGTPGAVRELVEAAKLWDSYVNGSRPDVGRPHPETSLRSALAALDKVTQ